MEWHTAHWSPTVRSRPSFWKNPVTPTTALSLRSASVVFGSSRFSLPWRRSLRTDPGSASTSTLRPAASAWLGEARADPSVGGAFDRLMELERVAPERLVAEGIEAEGLAALSELPEGVREDRRVRSGIGGGARGDPGGIEDDGGDGEPAERCEDGKPRAKRNAHDDLERPTGAGRVRPPLRPR